MSVVGQLDGLNRIYDRDGQLIVQANEKILSRSTGESIFVKQVLSDSSATVVERTKEPAWLYVTDRRIVFIRKPEPFEAARYSLNPLGLGDAVDKALKARQLRKAGAYEYVEVIYHNIRQFKVRKRKYANLLVVDGTEIYEIHLDQRSKTDNKLRLIWQLWEETVLDMKSPGQYSLVDYL